MTDQIQKAETKQPLHLPLDLVTGPIPKSLLAQRDEMLQAALRPEHQKFSIVAEYPLVLSHSESALATSFAVIAQNSVAGHANLFARRFVSESAGQSFKIGLIGNVATAASWRGRGIMHLLFNEIRQQAAKQDISVFVLWSDLLGFYQKLGFTSLGQEHRYHLLRSGCGQFTVKNMRLVAGHEVSTELASELLKIRCKSAGVLERSAVEFQKLLNIPDTFLFVASENHLPTAFAVVGKGADLIGVIHEWGISKARDQIDICSLAGTIMDAARIDELILLTPSTIAPTLQNKLETASATVEKVPMALGMKNPQSPQADAAWDALTQGFLWGLDSI